MLYKAKCVIIQCTCSLASNTDVLCWWRWVTIWWWSFASSSHICCCSFDIVIFCLSKCQFVNIIIQYRQQYIVYYLSICKFFCFNMTSFMSIRPFHFSVSLTVLSVVVRGSSITLCCTTFLPLLGSSLICWCIRWSGGCSFACWGGLVPGRGVTNAVGIWVPHDFSYFFLECLW